MPELHGTIDRVAGWMPDGLGQRIRFLFAVFAVLVAPLAALGLLVADVPLVPNGVGVIAALGIAAGWAVWQYRRNGLPWWSDPIPAVSLFLAGWLLGEPGSTFGLVFVLLYGRMLYGGGSRAWANAFGYVLAYEAAVVATAGSDALMHVGTLATVLGAAFSAGVMLKVGEVIRSHDRASRHEGALADAASRLQRAASHEAIYQVAAAAGLALCADVKGSALTLWRSDGQTLWMGHAAGPVADDTPLAVPLASLPADFRRVLLVGEPFALDQEASAMIQQAVDMDDTFVSMFIAPFVDGDRFGGCLAIASRQPLHEDLASALGRLTTDVALALARADGAVLLQRVVENSSDAIVLLGSSLCIDYASPAAGVLFGQSPEMLTGQPLDALLDAGGRDLRAALAQAATGPDAGCPLATARRADGTVRQVEFAATQMAGTGVDGWVVNLRDVTRRAEFERALSVSERRFRSLAENVSEGMYQMTLQPVLRYEYVNPAMEELCGFPAQAFLDDVDLTLRHVHPDDRAIIERTRTNPDELDWPVEVRWRHPCGDWVWISFRETVLHDADGAPTGSMGILSDITARKHQEQALQDALGQERVAAERLRRIDAMRTTFIQAVSHELRTPLTAITGYSQTLRRSHGRLDETTHATLLERLEANAHKLDRLLVDLLDVDRLSSDTIEPVRREVDVVRLVHRVVEQIDVTTHPVTCLGDSFTALLDAPKVERIVENLVRNAMKHTDPGTRIVVTAEADEAGDGATLTVVDDGPGIPRELVDQVFDPFIQGADSATAAAPGMGIGLSLVARFAELHGGHARVRNPDSGGAAFEVWLPGASAEEAIVRELRELEAAEVG